MTESDIDETPAVMSCFSATPVQNQVLLATALVNAENYIGEMHNVRVLLDQGSQASFITEGIVQYLRLRKIPVQGRISGLNGNRIMSCNYMVKLKLCSRINPNFTVLVHAYVLKTITGLLPSRRVSTLDWLDLSKVQLADPDYHLPSRVDILLGAEIYGKVIENGVIRNKSNTLVAQCTTFGWIISGALGYDQESSKIVVMHCSIEDELFNLKQFWEQETDLKQTNHKQKYTASELMCELIYKETTTRDEDGRYIVNLPFKKDPEIVKGNSKAIAIKCFERLEQKLMKDPSLKEDYKEVISEYLALGHMEIIPFEDQNNINSVYLPHHAVLREDKVTTKVRVVFNASQLGTNGVCLNDDLLVGPKLQPDLRHLIMNWRRYPICIVADIVKMYRQVKVADKHVDFQRIVWRDNPTEEIQHLRLLRVTFGTASAPYLAVKSLQQLAYDEGMEFVNASDRILKEFYMDDLLTGCHSIEEGKQIHTEMKTLLLKGGFPLQKWNSNNEDLRKIFKETEAKNEIKKENNNIIGNGRKILKVDTLIKILGLTWNQKSDEFEYSIQLPERRQFVTKRSIISDIARLFDPLGWLGPVIIRAKIFIQKLWLTGIGWDDEIPSHLLKDWLNYRKELSQLSKFSLPRWIKETRYDDHIELHGFGDASGDAYAAVVYSRIINIQGDIYVSLITSKTKVAPIKQVSIPRLELCAAVLVTRLLVEVSEVMGVPKENIHAWTDSKTVLAWLNSQPNKWQTYVANRVSEILTSLEPHQWSHVSSKDNSADCASRGSKNLEKELLWKEGPKWLKNKEIIYKRELRETSLEEKANKVCLLSTENNDDDDILIRFSSLRRLVRVVSYCKRFKHCKKEKWITSSEIQNSLKICIRISQTQSFLSEIEDLKEEKQLRKGNVLISLNPFVDGEGILRVGGRLQNAQISENSKHPIILAKKNHLTNLIISDAHEKTFHGGPQLMLNYLRSKYWIIGAKHLVKSYVHQCVVCIRQSAKTRQQLMGQLPASRGSTLRPFYHSGVDFAGPINIRISKGRGQRSYKGYVCLFICMATRAVHLEAVSDLTSEAFLAAFRRFVARRGHCAEIWSDNGSNFIGAARLLKGLFASERSQLVKTIAENLANNSTSWHFIPPYSPNFGGLWEAGIKSAKYHLRRVIGNSTLTFEEMTTLLSQIEACLNSRPMSKVSISTDDAVPLTPGHFLVGEPLVSIPDRNYQNSSLSSLRRWQLLQRMLQEFWKRWAREYLVQFHHRYKWSKISPEPSIGDVVLIMEENLPPARWLFGRITEKHTGSDGITRVVSLKCKSGIIKRPVSKLCLISN